MALSAQNIYQSVAIELDGNEFDQSTFVSCQLIYRGTGPVSLSRCTLSGSPFVFRGDAERTLSFLRAIYHGMGPGGQEIVESIFWNIRRLPAEANRPEETNDAQPVSS